MSWRDKLQKGSFRGAPFFWQKADGEVGRKTARHDYPLRDDCYVEDLGLAPPEFSLDVLVVGPDYMADRDNLVSALQQSGPGTLIHPTMGTFQVALNGKVRVSESTHEGGLCRFTIPFVVAGKNKYPTSRFNTSKTVALSASALYGKALSAFASAWSTLRMPAHVVQSAISSVLGAADTFLAIARLVPGIVPDLTFRAQIAALESSASNLLDVPEDLAALITAPITALTDLSDSASDRYKYHQALFSFGSDFTAISQTTSSRVREALNRAALVSLVRLSAISEASAAAAEMEFESFEAAVGARDELCAEIDSEMDLDATSDEVFSALTDLRAAVVADINERGANLARLVSYTPIRTMPALVLAYRLYGDAGKAEDIISRNHVSNPCFVPGGDPLEVLVYE